MYCVCPPTWRQRRNMKMLYTFTVSQKCKRTSANISCSSPSVGQHFSDRTMVPTSLSLWPQEYRLKKLKFKNFVLMSYTVSPHIHSFVRLVVEDVESIRYLFLELSCRRIGVFCCWFILLNGRTHCTVVRHFGLENGCLVTLGVGTSCNPISQGPSSDLEPAIHNGAIYVNINNFLGWVEKWCVDCFLYSYHALSLCWN